MAKPRSVAELIATPAIWIPDMTDSEWQGQIDAMFERALAARDFVGGKLTPDEFADCLLDHGYEPNTIFGAWAEGLTLL